MRSTDSRCTYEPLHVYIQGHETYPKAGKSCQLSRAINSTTTKLNLQDTWTRSQTHIVGSKENYHVIPIRIACCSLNTHMQTHVVCWAYSQTHIRQTTGKEVLPYLGRSLSRHFISPCSQGKLRHLSEPNVSFFACCWILSQSDVIYICNPCRS